MINLSLPAASLGAECTDLRREVREFLQEQLSAGRFRPSSDAWLTGWDPDFSRSLGERGWIGMTIPARYGGYGRTNLARYVVIEELLAAGAPLAAHWFADRQIAPALLAHGTEEQKQRYLPRIARGECFFALGMSEPDAGSDLAAVRMRADRVEGGGWRLSGNKIWTSGAHKAHAILLLARSASVVGGSKHAGLSQFICELPSIGITVNPIHLMSGAHHFNEVVFDNAEVPVGSLLGQEGNGWIQVTAELAHERSGPERFLSSFPLLAALTASGPDDIVVDDVVRRGVGELLARAWGLRQLSLSVASALSRGETPELEAALLKDLGTTFEQDLVDEVLRIVTTAELPGGSELRRQIECSVLQAPGFTLRGGTTEVLRGLVARGLGLR